MNSKLQNELYYVSSILNETIEKFNVDNKLKNELCYIAAMLNETIECFNLDLESQNQSTYERVTNMDSYKTMLSANNKLYDILKKI
jgi:two-component sensor histidine kinase